MDYYYEDNNNNYYYFYFFKFYFIFKLYIIVLVLASFNFMAAITICSDFGAPKIKFDIVSTVSPSILSSERK